MVTCQMFKVAAWNEPDAMNELTMLVVGSPYTLFLTSVNVKASCKY